MVQASSKYMVFLKIRVKQVKKTGSKEGTTDSDIEFDKVRSKLRMNKR